MKGHDEGVRRTYDEQTERRERGLQQWGRGATACHIFRSLNFGLFRFAVAAFQSGDRSLSLQEAQDLSTLCKRTY